VGSDIGRDAAHFCNDRKIGVVDRVL
jgi:hypothetical protein